jgi:endonuclease/exonuclease/phosphatase family metal-dependent hydrolase
MTKPTDLSVQVTGEPALIEPPQRTGRRRTVLAWTLTAPWGAWLIIRLTGADRLSLIELPAVPLLAVTQYVAATAPIPIICAVLLRRRRAAVAAGLVAAVLAVVVLPRAIGSGQPAAAGPELRVLTANLFFSRVDPDHVVDLVRRNHVDVLSLQELTPDGVEALEDAGLLRDLPYKVIDPRWGAAGSGLYARRPLRAAAPVPGAAFAMPQARLTTPGGPLLEVSAVHPPPATSRSNIRAWRHDLDALPAADRQGPVRLLIGDFNATLDHARMRAVLGRGYADAADRVGKGLVLTWGIARFGPPLTLDHILVDERVAVRRFDVYDLPGGDHRAVFAHLRLP